MKIAEGSAGPAGPAGPASPVALASGPGGDSLKSSNGAAEPTGEEDGKSCLSAFRLNIG